MKPQYPLVFSTLLIRLAVGVIIVHIIMAMGGTTVVSDWIVAVFSMCCVIVGVILSMTHLGKPQRFLNSFANPKSMLTLEAYFIPALIGSMFLLAIGSYFNLPVWLTGIGKIGTVLFGLILIYVTAKVYHLKARPSWSTSLVVYEFFLSAICLGLLGYIGLVPFFWEDGGCRLAIFDWNRSMIVLLAELVVTLYYRHYVKVVSKSAAEVLQDSSSQFYLWICLGLAVPFLMCGVTLITREIYSLMVFLCFISFFLGALFWRVLFFKTSTPLKITPDIAEN